MKVLLVSINSSYGHTSYALRLLAANAGTPVQTAEFNINMRQHSVLNAIIESGADIVCFSCYIWNIEYIMRLCGDIKIAMPNARIILGGPEVSFAARRFEGICDYIVRGEGEEVFKELLHALESGGEINISGVTDGKAETGYRYIADLDSIKEPEAAYAPDSIVYYESSRGCPFSCKYCLSGAISGGVRYKSLERIFADLDKLKTTKPKIIKFVDRTFNANEERAARILEYVLGDKSDTKYHFEFGLDLAGERVMALLLKTPEGKLQIEAGVQSVNEGTLCAVARKTNIKRLAQNAARIVDRGNIHLHLDLIAGLPHEDMKSFRRSFDAVFAMRPHTLQLGFLKLLYGARIREEARSFGIEAREYPPYEVIKTNDMSAGELLLLKKMADSTDIFHNEGAFFHSFAELTREVSAFDVLKGLTEFLKAMGERPLGIKDRFESFYTFAQGRLDEHKFVRFIKRLKIDWLRGGYRGSAPFFIKDEARELKPYLTRLKSEGKLSAYEIRNDVFAFSDIDIETGEDRRCIVSAKKNARDLFGKCRVSVIERL